MHSRFPSLITFIICLFAVSLIAQDQAPTPERYKVFDTYDDLQAHISKYANQTVVINFWATYCAPCVKEVPFFDQLQEKYRANNVKVIMVNLDFKSQLKQRLDKYLNDHPIPNLEIVVLADQDADSWVPRVTSDWDGSLPFTMVLSKGVLKDTHRQEFSDFDDLVKFVAPHVPPKPTLASKRRR
jgi:thiol-disulfide isomerase/thioredoxin